MLGGRISLGGWGKALLVGAAIVLVLVAVAVLALSPVVISHRRPKSFWCGRKLRDTAGASSNYRKDLGEFPAAKDATELARILSSETEHDGRVYGPYMMFREKTAEKASLDPWGTRLFYERSPDGQSFRLGSAGPDRKFGTEDDIWVGEPDRAK